MLDAQSLLCRAGGTAQQPDRADSLNASVLAMVLVVARILQSQHCKPRRVRSCKPEPEICSMPG